MLEPRSSAGLVPMKVAAIQATPRFLDSDATLELTIEMIEEAARADARLIVFPEAFVPGYPDWVWRARPWAGD